MEFDWTANWQVDRHLGLLLGVSDLASGAMIEQSDTSNATPFACLQATLIF